MVAIGILSGAAMARSISITLRFIDARGVQTRVRHSKSALVAARRGSSFTCVAEHSVVTYVVGKQILRCCMSKIALV